MEQQLQSLEREVNGLKTQVSELSKSRPWYTKVSSLVAVSALLLSIATTSVSYVKGAHQDYLSSRVELRGLISAISKIPLEHAELTRKYGDKPEIMGPADLAGHVLQIPLEERSF